MADTNPAGDPVMSLMLQVSEMKGMLGQALGDMGSRISGHDASLTEQRVNLDQVRNEHTDTRARVTNMEHDISEIKAAQAGVFMKVVSVMSPIVATAALVITVFQRTQ